MLKSKNNFENILIFFFSIYPVSFLIGNLFINLSIIIISTIYLVGIFLKKIKFKVNDKFFILLLFFFITLLINLIFTNNISLSYQRVVKFIFIIFFVLAYRNLILLENNQLNYVYKFWSLIFIIVCIDLIFEFFSGFNIFGLKSHVPGRLGGFTGSESVIGNYFSAFVLLTLSFFYRNYYNNKILSIFIVIILISIAFLIGERSNFIKTLIIISLFVFFIYKFNLKHKLFSIILLVFCFALFLNFNESYKIRYIKQPLDILKSNPQKDVVGISSPLEIYGAHFKVAKEIFKDNPIFGVGIKNFRIESFDKKYEGILGLSEKWTGGSTHPHQIHYEFLSETGIFGYLCFLIFIILSIYWSFKSYIVTKNVYQFSAMLFVIVNLIPLLPSGSFFTTYSSGLFWINYAIMVGYVKKY